MFSISFKVAYPIIIGGLFIMVIFVALNYQTLNASFYVVLCLLLAYIFLFGFAIGQNFAQPIKKLLKKADELVKGNVKSRFYVKEKNEFGELANAFNKIAEKLEETKVESDKLEQSIDLRVKARTQPLEETISALDQKVKNRTLELERIMADLERYKAQPKLKETQSKETESEDQSTQVKKNPTEPKKKRNSKKIIAQPI